LTALLLALAGGGCGWRRLGAEAGRTPSPNSGWPMAAMALALGVRLGKPGAYVLNAGAPAPGAADGRRAQALAARAVGGLLLVAALAIVLQGGLP
jgi:adenosylcobinamide-phosphate synthase